MAAFWLVNSLYQVFLPMPLHSKLWPLHMIFSGAVQEWQMSNSHMHWGRVVIGGLLAEVVLILAIVPLGLRLGESFLHYAAPPGSFLTCLGAALWVTRRAQSRFFLHGVLVGVVAALIYVSLTRAQPEPLVYVVAQGLKVLGGSCGGFVAGRRFASTLKEEHPVTD